MGWQAPIFVHVPVINGPDGKKLSKRHGDTRCLDFRAAGYLSEALANFIALIGWAPGGDLEVMSMEDMSRLFDISGLQPSPGIFDSEKLKWMNGAYLRSLTLDELVERIRTYVIAPDTKAYWLSEAHSSPSTWDDLCLLANALETDTAYAAKAVGLEQERVTTLAEFGAATRFFFVPEVEFDPKAVEKWKGQPHTEEMFLRFMEDIKGYGPGISAEGCEQIIRAFAAEREFEKLGPVVHPTRVALSGKTVGPGLFELMSVLGPERMISRFTKAIPVLK
jgi:glutamyl-tRNA synthetase